jgi:hypothetical protein
MTSIINLNLNGLASAVEKICLELAFTPVFMPYLIQHSPPSGLNRTGGVFYLREIL